MFVVSEHVHAHVPQAFVCLPVCSWVCACVLWTEVVWAEKSCLLPSFIWEIYNNWKISTLLCSLAKHLCFIIFKKSILWVFQYFHQWRLCWKCFCSCHFAKSFLSCSSLSLYIYYFKKKVAVEWIINYLKWELICSLKLVFPNGIWMHLCANVLPWLSFSAIFGNQLEAWVGCLLIFQPIAMKHCCERLLNYVFSAVCSLLLFSRIPLLKWTQRLHYCVSECGW